MSFAKVESVEPTPAGVSPAPPVQVRRTPFYCTSQGASLFAWLHQSEADRHCQRGVIICAPVGYEQIHAHRSLRHLADALAAAGFPTMRIDYNGTGDSAGTDENPDRHATWLANLRSAMSWMRDELGCEAVGLVGLRLGAALAAQVAALEPVHDLVLWTPVIKGRAYVREMKALSMASGGAADQSKDMEAAGFVMTEQTARDLGAIDLLQLQPKCRRALIVSRDDLPTDNDNKLLAHLGSLGIAAEQTAQPGYAGMMAEPHFTIVPQQAIATIVAWLRAEKEDAARFLEPRKRSDTYLGWPLERPVRICQDPDLFGIVSEPNAAASSGAEHPTILLPNAGGASRVGPNRLHVCLARRLAAHGFRCLRMDICGLGDSVIADPARENDTYPATAFRDIGLAMAFLERELGVRKVILMGLCSGAYVAFQSASQFQSPALVASVVINPLTFFWKEGMKLETAESLKFQAFQHSMESARQLGKWVKLLTGRSKLGIRGAFRLLFDRWKLKRQARRAASLGGSNNDGVTRVPSHPKKDDVPGDLANIVKHGRALTFFFSRSDPGYDILTFRAKAQVEEMCRTGQMRVNFIEDADHKFARRAWREALLDGVVADLCRLNRI